MALTSRAVPVVDTNELAWNQVMKVIPRSHRQMKYELNVSYWAENGRIKTSANGVCSAK